MVGTVHCAVQRRVQARDLGARRLARPQLLCLLGAVLTLTCRDLGQPRSRAPLAQSFMVRFAIEIQRSPIHPRRVTHLAKAREVFDIEVAALRKVRTLLDQSFDNAVELVAETLSRRGKIVIVGIG